MDYAFVPVPEAFSGRIVAAHGEAGRSWLAGLPRLLDECVQRWRLAIDPPFEPFTWNWVATATREDGERVVLKAGMPGNGLEREAAALRAWDGRGSARLLEANVARGVLLLERLEPGVPLAALAAHLDDDAATMAAATVMRLLWRPAAGGYTFPSVEEWCQQLTALRASVDRGKAPFPTVLVSMAQSLFAELVESMGARVLLHGDLHHANILSATRQPWLAVDPKGIVGEPECEIGALLRNPPAGAAPHARSSTRPRPAHRSAVGRTEIRSRPCRRLGCRTGGSGSLVGLRG